MLDFSSGESSEELAIKLFADLSKKLIQQLYELYKIDFDMFDYDYKKFTMKWINEKNQNLSITTYLLLLNMDTRNQIYSLIYIILFSFLPKNSAKIHHFL